MKKHLLALTAACLFLAPPASARNYLLNGGQDSAIRYRMVQSVNPTPSTRRLVLSYVQPASYTSPTYNQKIKRFDLSFSPEPASRESQTDEHGNQILTATWQEPPAAVTATISLDVKNSVTLDTIKTTAPFPVTALPDSMKPYLQPTGQVQSDHPRIQKRAAGLTVSAKTQFDAVRQILTWLVDHMRYVQPPQQYDALYALESGQGNCQNYSHLAAALMRAAGIPVRIVNGVTLKRPYEIKQNDTTLVMKNAQGRHSWIEVYFPDLGWVPLDPQQTEMFVSNRFIRVEVGSDNEDTENDGLIRWTRVKGASGTPTFREEIAADFLTDQVSLTGQGLDYGPRNRLFGPEVAARFRKTVIKEEEPEPVNIPPQKLETLSYTEPFVFGNLAFPANLDFQSARAKVEKTPDGSLKMAKSFLVETAEYVTTKGKKYAQSFVLTKPLRLSTVSLALHDFGRNGQLWVELSRDEKGIPQPPLATSEILSLAGRKPASGYQWVDFDFTRKAPTLKPGRYWLALGFTGGPIVNWFFSYGKPTGPQDGTRYRTLFDEQWSHSLSFEFNYRVQGLIPKSFAN